MLGCCEECGTEIFPEDVMGIEFECPNCSNIDLVSALV